MFKKLPFHKEYEILSNDDGSFSNTKEYLRPLIDKAIENKAVKNKKEISDCIYKSIPIAIKRFLINQRNITSKTSFATYFTWYIHECFKKHDSKKIIKRIGAILKE